MKTITITAFNRPGYLKRVLHTLLKNSLSGWDIVIALDPSEVSRKVKQTVTRALRGRRYSIVENEHQLGVRDNPYAVQSMVFETGSDINIYLEDDTIVSPDVTGLADWYRALDLRDIVCLNLLYGSCGGRGHRSDPHAAQLICATRNFNSLGYVCTKQQWSDHLSRYWYCERSENHGWDWAVLTEISVRPALRVLQPLLARANHIGRLGGTHCPVSFHDTIYAPLRINKKKDAGPYLLRFEARAG